MIAGTVTPPGCFLDAPEMLKRQYLAFCLDTWASEAANTGVMPPKVMLLLAGNKRGEFPANFLKWYASNRDRLCERFLSLFQGVLSEDNVARMSQFALSEELPGVRQEALSSLCLLTRTGSMRTRFPPS
jgi:DEAD/DEAH box helicase domain-containing protein